ncbi:MAG: hypothetical protein K2X81_13850 [Candidatus Obscuribacterales bacterium]|nr:hypothetical protein [Candidatus Obscuribacterales bacterium]
MQIETHDFENSLFKIKELIRTQQFGRALKLSNQLLKDLRFSGKRSTYATSPRRARLVEFQGQIYVLLGQLKRGRTCFRKSLAIHIKRGNSEAHQVRLGQLCTQENLQEFLRFQLVHEVQQFFRKPGPSVLKRSTSRKIKQMGCSNNWRIIPAR